MDAHEREALTLRLWPWLKRLTLALAVINLLIALAVRLWGAGMHPAFVDPHAWLLFLVTGASLAGQALVMAWLERLLTAEAAGVAVHGGRRRWRRQLRRPLLRWRHAARHRRVACAELPARAVARPPWTGGCGLAG
jgi:hypothetical protein